MEQDINSITVNIEKVLETECIHCHQAIDVSDLEVFSDIECPHCGKAMKVPGKLGNFTLLDIMGKGGMGSVYRARDEVLGRQVAIKVVLPALAEDKDFIATFKHEAQAAARVNHPHIAQIYSFGEENGHPYIVMELVTGRGLDRLIESGKTLDQGLIMRIGMDIAEGLREADEMGLIHGDIKPENILLDEKMNGKLIDFGIASVGGAEAADGIWGTPYYIAPEKLRREKADARSDIYCLGATLYHALSGQPPFDGETPAEVVKARLENEPPPLREIRPDIDEEVERIIIRMLKTDRSQRYPTYTSLLGDMHKVVDVLKPLKNRSNKSKKIIIKKRGVAITPSSPGKIKISSTPSQANAPVDKSVELTAEEKANRKKSLLKILWIFLAIVAFIGISAGAVLFKLNKDKDIRMRRAEYALGSAADELNRANIKIQLAVSNIVKQASVTVELKNKIASVSSIVTGEDVADILPRLVPPVKIEPVVVAAPDDGGVSNNVSTNAEASASNAVPEIAEGASNEVADVVEAEAAAEPESEPVEEINDPPIIVLAKKAFVHIADIDEMVALALKVGNDSVQVTADALRSRHKKEIATVMMGLEDKQDQLISIKKKIAKTIKKIDSIMVEMDTVRGNTVAQREEERKARLEAERQKQKEAEEARIQAAHEADVESDFAQISGAGAEVKKAIQLHSYADVIDDLSKKKKQLKTDEGREALSIYIDRAVYMRNLKKFLIKQLNNDPFKWGWTDSGSPEDILKATPKRIILKGRSVLWENVSVKQFFHFIKHYVTDMNKNVKLVELGKQSMAAAVFCYEHKAYDAAESYALKAVELYPPLAKDADRLFPAPVEDEESVEE